LLFYDAEYALFNKTSVSVCDHTDTHKRFMCKFTQGIYYFNALVKTEITRWSSSSVMLW
jgi:hypothetical protein